MMSFPILGNRVRLVK